MRRPASRCAIVDSTGVDFAGALDYGRSVAGQEAQGDVIPRTRRDAEGAWSGAEGAQGRILHRELSHRRHASDAWVDIEGGIGTMLTYASKARFELPNTLVLTDGDVEQLSKDNSFSAQHIYTPLQGVAVHINAFNFPVWGMLEKIAPTLIAGVPCVVKPASQTAYLTELVVRRIIETGILPEGALQLISGSVGDLLDHVTGQDVVTFTGSAWTGQKLRCAQGDRQANSVRFTMEADSLNASILGPDAVPGTPEFDLFVKEVAREMTVKAGQKCTAIRRVIAPRDTVDAVIKALGERLARRRSACRMKKARAWGRSPRSTSATRCATGSRICRPTPRLSRAIPTMCGSSPATRRRGRS
jgi:oxepin-CoA hydrolase/3-oxo-5,6-dehydrosuberyl-CoA semialdehyde dehydrogenase